MKIDIIRSKRKTLAVEIKRDLSVLVRAPLFVSEKEIRRFLAEKSAWIEKHINKMKAKQETTGAKLTQEELCALVTRAKDLIPKRVSYYADLIGTSYGRITIRKQVSRWGSCSGKGNLNFNCLLVLCPAEVLDYVVIHELCHRREMNHSQNFWRLVAQFCPDYKEHKKWLKENGNDLIEKLK